MRRWHRFLKLVREERQALFDRVVHWLILGLASRLDMVNWCQQTRLALTQRWSGRYAPPVAAPRRQRLRAAPPTPRPAGADG